MGSRFPETDAKELLEEARAAAPGLALAVAVASSVWQTGMTVEKSGQMWCRRKINHA
ncbi:MAG: hypothetical protein LBT40_06205 [Deltaproteobacteria bacterium]|jgi:hypothetical protein|nr:hypothetical protein [Deltaproteobacteria bacterium]